MTAAFSPPYRSVEGSPLQPYDWDAAFAHAQVAALIPGGVTISNSTSLIHPVPICAARDLGVAVLDGRRGLRAHLREAALPLPDLGRRLCDHHRLSGRRLRLCNARQDTVPCLACPRHSWLRQRLSLRSSGEPAGGFFYIPVAHVRSLHFHCLSLWLHYSLTAFRCGSTACSPLAHRLSLWFHYLFTARSPPFIVVPLFRSGLSRSWTAGQRGGRA